MIHRTGRHQDLRPNTVSQQGSRTTSAPTLKMWLFPYLTWVSIASIVALAAVVVGIGVWRYRKGGPAGPAVEAPQGEDAAVGACPAS